MSAAMASEACLNTDREIWRGPDEGNGSYYADSIHVTEAGGIGINCGGHVIVMPVREWHRVAVGCHALASRLAEATKHIEFGNDAFLSLINLQTAVLQIEKISDRCINAEVYTAENALSDLQDIRVAIKQANHLTGASS